MMPPQFGKRSLGKYHYHPHHDELDQSDGVLMGGILLALWGLWWLVAHWVDHLLGNLMVWWLEPLTLLAVLPPVGFLAMASDRYDSWNPLHWWPMCWGTKIRMDREKHWHMAFDNEHFVENNGGRYNVYCGTGMDEEPYLKFRKKRDAVIFSLQYL